MCVTTQPIAEVSMESIVAALPDVGAWVDFSVSQLPPRAINWLVACIENPTRLADGFMDGSHHDLDQDDEIEPHFAPAHNQRQLGVLIDRELIGTIPFGHGKWLATITSSGVTYSHHGSSRAEAALRSFIAKYLGNKVKVPTLWAA